MDNESKTFYHYRSNDQDDLALYSVKQITTPNMKPTGIWLSDCSSYGWEEWCRDSEGGLHQLRSRYVINLNLSEVLNIQTTEELLKFNDTFSKPIYGEDKRRSNHLNSYHHSLVNWSAVAQCYKGIVISPYNWSQRLELVWYYGWDCASACVWDVSCVDHIYADTDYNRRQKALP